MGLTYFKRAQTGLFYDYNRFTFVGTSWRDYQSVGLELLFDNTAINLLPLTFGIRASYLLQDEPNNRDQTLVSSFFVEVIPE